MWSLIILRYVEIPRYRCGDYRWSVRDSIYLIISPKVIKS